MIEIDRILCPVDFSDYSDHALRYAMQMASWYRASLHVMHVMPVMPPSTTSPMGEAGRQLTARNLASILERCREADVEVEGDLIESADPSSRILERAEALDVDLIVTGSHGRKGLRRVVLGSVVEPLLHRSRRPVLVIPAGLSQARLDHPARFDRIVCAVDFAAASLEALAYAFSIAEERDAHIALVNVIERPPELEVSPQSPDFDIDRIHAQAAAERLTRLRALVPQHSRECCTVEAAVLEGAASRHVLQLAQRQDADLIVLGVHGRNALDVAVFGSNAKDIVRQAHCPVLVVPGSHRRMLRSYQGGAMSAISRRPTVATPCRLDADEAFIGLVICAMEANRHAAPSEAARAEHIIWSMARFRNRSGAVVGSLIARMKRLVGEAAPHEILDAVCQAIPVRLRPSAFAIAADVTLVDGRLERTERMFLNELARRLRLTPDVAAAILGVIRVKNRA